MNIQFTRAVLADADALIAVQNQCFYADFIRYGECPGYNRSREGMLESIARKQVYLIRREGQTVGDIIVSDLGGGNYYLGCICVLPAYENKGIGQLTMRFLDFTFPQAKHWALETPADKTRNHYFYRKHGYTVTREYTAGKVRISYFERDV